jgi:hypothetical protein
MDDARTFEKLGAKPWLDRVARIPGMEGVPV